MQYVNSLDYAMNYTELFSLKYWELLIMYVNKNLGCLYLLPIGLCAY